MNSIFEYYMRRFAHLLIGASVAESLIKRAGGLEALGAMDWAERRRLTYAILNATGRTPGWYAFGKKRHHGKFVGKKRPMRFKMKKPRPIHLDPHGERPLRAVKKVARKVAYKKVAAVI